MDGVQIDASIVIGLPTDKQWEGGGLTVWDGKPEHLGHMEECCALDPISFHNYKEQDGILRLKELDSFERYMEKHRGDKNFGDYSWITANIKLSPKREVLYYRKVLDFARIQTTA